MPRKQNSTRGSRRGSVQVRSRWRGPGGTLEVGVALFGVFVSVSLASRESLAWNFDEHKALCKEGYAQACKLVEPEARKDALATSRWEIACNPGRSLDDVYGQACALAGDRVGSPDDLTTAHGGVRASSDVHYYLLALINAEHFQPQSMRYWLDYHVRALALTREAKAQGDGAQILTFERGLFMSAFADHFLADSFAAGHMGFNRAASSAGAAKAYHDVWNENGRWLRSADGAEWFAKGDGHIKEGETWNRVLKAEVLAVREVLETFVLSSAPRDYTQEVWDVAPVAVSAIHRKYFPLWFRVDDYQRADTHPSPETFEPLSEVRMPAKYAYAWGLSPELQYPFSGTAERDIMAQLTLGPYQAKMPIIHGFYLDFRVGYGRDGDPLDRPRSGQRHGPAFGVNLDFPLVKTANGLLYGDFVVGAQSLWWKRIGGFVALRGNLYLGPYLLQLTVGVADRYYDHEMGDRTSHRGAILTALTVGKVEGSYVFRAGGVPQAPLLGE